MVPRLPNLPTLYPIFGTIPIETVALCKYEDTFFIHHSANVQNTPTHHVMFMIHAPLCHS